jgi:ribosomal subunit interface protein
MHISTTARHCELDSELRELAKQKLERLERFASDIHEAHLIVTAEKGTARHVAEVTLRLNHHELVSREESPELRQALLAVLESLEHQLRRFKEKRLNRSHRPGVAPSPSPAPADDDGLDEEE